MRATRRVRAGRLAATPAGTLLFVLILTSLVGQALAVPAVARLAGLPSVRLLDYNRQIGTLAPLSDAYVRRALGLLPLGSTSGKSDPASLPGLHSARHDVQNLGHDEAAITARHPFSNDDFDHAYAVTGLPFTGSTDTTGQSRQAGEPSSCSATGGTAWYRYTPSRDRTLLADTLGTSYADTLGIFTGAKVDALKQVSCSSSPTGDARTGFQARQGTTYWFQIGGTVSGGHLVFHLLPIGTTQRLSTQTKQEPPAVSRDGLNVAFTGFPTGPMTGARACHTHPWCAALFLADLRTGRVRILLSLHPDLTTKRNIQNPTPEPSLSGVSLSDDGRYVAFGSDDHELVDGDTNAAPDVFVFDRVTGDLERVSVGSDGSQAHLDPVYNNQNGPCTDDYSPSGSFTPSLSGDGRFVAFNSDADNLGEHDKNGCAYVFLHDRLTGRTELASVDADGKPFDKGGIAFASHYVSADGRYVVVELRGAGRIPQMYIYDRLRHRSEKVTNAVRVDTAVISADGSRVAFLFYPKNTNNALVGTEGLAVFDQGTGKIARVVDSSSGSQQESIAVYLQGTSAIPSLSISATGRYVAFTSTDSSLVPGDGNTAQDVFVYDLDTRAFALVSRSSAGEQYTIDSSFPSISGDGRTIAFVQGGESFSDTSVNDVTLLVHRSVRAGTP